ncbi:uncharacterized protein LOC128396681 [Panonychus citri]|uniref:uncharacterized protein LOC128391256 n=1 Tax=Panonychus citri TaxID=50023 RepID=UPI002306F8C7|nr:uncharacterized protein LOC128391256 [Panonychus citri]XP_053213273.1 uncharacterized protein LOC128396681 [Panonychus citri]
MAKVFNPTFILAVIVLLATMNFGYFVSAVLEDTWTSISSGGSIRAESNRKMDPMIRRKRSGKKKRCSPAKLPSGTSSDAVGEALHKVMTNIPLNGIKTLEHSNIGGDSAWAIGKCWNGLSHDSCKSCIRDLVDNIWTECENAKGARLRDNNCGIRYEIYELTFDNSEDSFVFNN